MSHVSLVSLDTYSSMITYQPCMQNGTKKPESQISNGFLFNSVNLSKNSKAAFMATIFASQRHNLVSENQRSQNFKCAALQLNVLHCILKMPV